MALFSRNSNTNQNNGTLALQSKIQNYIENFGMNAEEVMTQIQNETIEQIERDNDRKHGISKEEKFPEEIKIISQALAYREVNDEDDFEEIYAVLNQSYQEEIHGKEAFRTGPLAIEKEVVQQYLEDKSYHWMVAEAPNGRQIEKDGVIIGVACFSTDGISKRNGVVEGNVGSIRFFGILTRFRGLCVGRRFLSKIEDLIFKKFNCVRVLANIPSSRQSLRKWIEERQYVEVAALPYPFEPLRHIPSSREEEVQLIQYVKWNNTKDSKDVKEREQKSESHLPPIFRKNLPVVSDIIYDDDGDEELLGVD